MSEFRGFDPQSDWKNIPNKVYDELMADTQSLTEMKLIMIFATGYPFFTTTQLARLSGQTRVSVFTYLRDWKAKGLICNTSLAPRILAKKGIQGRCWGCGIQYPFLDTHHIVPLSKGGEDILENQAQLCPNCHRLVHHKVWVLTSAGRKWLGLGKTDEQTSD
jgi:hypothetical protein